MFLALLKCLQHLLIYELFVSTHYDSKCAPLKYFVHYLGSATVWMGFWETPSQHTSYKQRGGYRRILYFIFEWPNGQLKECQCSGQSTGLTKIGMSGFKLVCEQ